MIGQKVAYSVQFLHSISESPTGELCHWRGIVLYTYSVGSLKLAKVKWDHMENPISVNVHNLAIVGPNSKFANCGLPTQEIPIASPVKKVIIPIAPIERNHEMSECLGCDRLIHDDAFICPYCRHDRITGKEKRK